MNEATLRRRIAVLVMVALLSVTGATSVAATIDVDQAQAATIDEDLAFLKSLE
jgi:hypothetical protein